MARRFDRDAFSDEELLAIGARGRASGRGRFLSGLFVVAALTFAAGYYVPLYRTHQALLKDYTSLSERATAAERDLGTARSDLVRATAHSEQLSTERATADANAHARAARLMALQTVLKSKLPAQAGKGQIAVTGRDDSVVVTVTGMVEQGRGGHMDATAAAPALCEVATAVGASAFGIDVVAYGAGMPKSPTDSEWDTAGRSAASVAEALEEKCKFPGARLRTTTRLAPDGASADASGQGIRVDLEIHAKG